MLGVLYLSSCSKNDEPVIPPAAKAIKCSTGDTVKVGYGQTLDLTTIFSLDPAEATGTLTYTLVRQFSYAEGTGNVTWDTLNVYSLSGSKLTSASVRVPDAFQRVESEVVTAQRLVQDGVIEVGLEGSDLTPVRFVIQQTDKPALAPPKVSLNIDPDKYTQDGPNGAYLLTLSTSNTPTNFSQTGFTVEPYDYDPNNIWLYPSPGAKYIIGRNSTPAYPGVKVEGFDNYGTGEYVVAFYSATVDGVDDAYAKAVAAVAAGNTAAAGVAVLYVNVNYVPPTSIIGIQINPGVGTVQDNSIRYRASGTLAGYSPIAFVQAVLADGSAVDYDTNKYGPLLVGELEGDAIGGSSPSATYPGWFSNLSLLASPGGSASPWPVGTPVKFTVTRPGNAAQPPDNTFMKDGWTVVVDTEIIAPAS